MHATLALGSTGVEDFTSMRLKSRSYRGPNCWPGNRYMMAARSASTPMKYCKGAVLGVAGSRYPDHSIIASLLRNEARNYAPNEPTRGE